MRLVIIKFVCLFLVKSIVHANTIIYTLLKGYNVLFVNWKSVGRPEDQDGVQKAMAIVQVDVNAILWENDATQNAKTVTN